MERPSRQKIIMETQALTETLDCACVPNRFSHVWLFVTLWTVAHQAPLFTGFSRQEYWSELPCPPPGDLPDPGIKLTSFMSPALADRFFTTSTTWEAPDTNTFISQFKLNP